MWVVLVSQEKREGKGRESLLLLCRAGSRRRRISLSLLPAQRSASVQCSFFQQTSPVELVVAIKVDTSGEVGGDVCWNLRSHTPLLCPPPFSPAPSTRRLRSPYDVRHCAKPSAAGDKGSWTSRDSRFHVWRGCGACAAGCRWEPRFRFVRVWRFTEEERVKVVILSLQLFIGLSLATCWR